MKADSYEERQEAREKSQKQGEDMESGSWYLFCPLESTVTQERYELIDIPLEMGVGRVR